MNRKRGTVTVEIGGEHRPLRLDFNAIAELEQRHGKPVHELFANLGLGVLRDAIFYGLRSGDPARTRTLTLEKVGTWLSDESERLEEFTNAIAESAMAAMPGFSDGPAEVPPVAPAAATPAPAVRDVAASSSASPTPAAAVKPTDGST